MSPYLHMHCSPAIIAQLNDAIALGLIQDPNLDATPYDLWQKKTKVWFEEVRTVLPLPPLVFRYDPFLTYKKNAACFNMDELYPEKLGNMLKVFSTKPARDVMSFLQLAAYKHPAPWWERQYSMRQYAQKMSRLANQHGLKKTEDILTFTLQGMFGEQHVLVAQSQDIWRLANGVSRADALAELFTVLAPENNLLYFFLTHAILHVLLFPYMAPEDIRYCYGLDAETTYIGLLPFHVQD